MRVVRTRPYERDLRRLGARDEDIRAAEDEIAQRPDIGVPVPGLRGIRKCRVALKGRGKRGGGRVYYFVWVLGATIYLLRIYSKSEREDLSPDDKKALVRLLDELQGERR